MASKLSRQECSEHIKAHIEQLNEDTLKNIATYINLIETHESYSEKEASRKPSSPDGEKLYRRSIEDFLALQSLLFGFSRRLENKDEFLSILDEKGHDETSLQEFMNLSLSLDNALIKLIDLIHFSEIKRPKMDARNGYTLNFGDSVFTRFYFGQK